MVFALEGDVKRLRHRAGNLLQGLLMIDAVAHRRDHAVVYRAVAVPLQRLLEPQEATGPSALGALVLDVPASRRAEAGVHESKDCLSTLAFENVILHQTA